METDLLLIDNEEAGIFEREEVITSTELERLEVDESLIGYERELFLLKDGLPVQKNSALSSLPNTLAEFDSNERDISSIIAIFKTLISNEEAGNVAEGVFQSIFKLIVCDTNGKMPESIKSPMADEDIDPCIFMWRNFETSNDDLSSDAISFNPLLSDLQVTDNLLPLLITFMQDSEHESLCVAASHCVVQAIRRISVPIQETKIIQLAMDKGDVAEPIYSRVICSRIIGAVAAHCQLPEDVASTMFLSKMIELCQDTAAEVRQCMCEQMDALSRSVGIDTASDDLLPELLELLQDEEIGVKREAYCAMITLIDFFPTSKRREDIIPTLEAMVNDPPVDCIEVITKTFGIVVYKLNRIGDFTESVATSFLDAFVKLTGSDEVETRRLCAFNFPALLSSCGASQYGAQLDEAYNALAQDEDMETRLSIASSIHEVSHILGQQRVIRYIKNIMLSLLIDEVTEVRSMAILRLNHMMDYFAAIVDEQNKSLTMTTILSAIVDHDTGLEIFKWRTQQQYLETLRHFPKYFPSTQLHEFIVPVLVKHMVESARPVKCTAARVYLWYTRRNETQSQRYMNISRLRTEFGNGSSSSHRSLFLDSCVSALEFNSRSYFKMNFLDTVLDLLDDPVPNIRLKALSLLPSLVSMIEASDEAILEKYEKIVLKERVESDSDVSNALIVCRDRIEKMASTYDKTSSFEDVAKMDEEEKLGMSHDNECSSLDGKYSDMFEYSFTVNKDGSVSRRARVKSLDVTIHNAPSANSSRTNSTNKGKQSNISNVQRGKKHPTHQLPACAGSSSPSGRLSAGRIGSSTVIGSIGRKSSNARSGNSTNIALNSPAGRTGSSSNINTVASSGSRRANAPTLARIPSISQPIRPSGISTTSPAKRPTSPTSKTINSPGGNLRNGRSKDSKAQVTPINRR